MTPSQDLRSFPAEHNDAFPLAGAAFTDPQVAE